MTITVRDTLLIGGEWRKPSAGDRIQVVSPSTENVLGQVPDAGADDVDMAVGAAREAFDHGPWRRMPLQERVTLLERALDALEPQLPSIAELVTAEMGLPSAIAAKKIPGAPAAGRLFLRTALEIPESEVLQTPYGPTAVLREPVGVVAAIAPWNSPFNMAVTKIVPALVTGCSVVYKPAPETPLDVFPLAEALTAAGLPPGVLNLVTGGTSTGQALVAHPGVDKVSFTGSTAAGRHIARTCADRFTRLQLELGGKSAAIVLADADPATVVRGIAMGSFGNTGQTCSAYSRILVPAHQYDQWLEAVTAAAQSFTVGDPRDPATTMGPLVSAAQRDRVLGYISVGKAEGARLVCGGGAPEGLERGYYVQPTVFACDDNSLRICQEEIFGPVAVVLPYTDLEQALRIAEDSPYGLHGAVFTQDPQAAAQVTRSVRTGTFSVNSFVHNTHAPFGGMKASGIGRELGRAGIEAFHELRTVNLTPETAPLFG
ncbi:aldehyde dehydrogenase [Streptomyces sp. NPDC057474]|uniref:aldehyde dehydrogenase n=1 Tax=Streptomyces sp. NPDC057474 TaxID=3346144 RepID=UPI0036C3C58E